MVNGQIPILFALHGPNLGCGNSEGVPAFLFGNMPTQAPSHSVVRGITRDANGIILGSCTVKLFRTSDDALMDRTTSDPSTGVYTLQAALGTNYYVVAYKAGSPDVEGTTANTVVAAPV